ncbi:MAG: helix-turn-helix domain-containing protein [Bacteroidales bacterium]|nr:helix-turn-helix domain-containing protein [Bacteroidales bacterium]
MKGNEYVSTEQGGGNFFGDSHRLMMKVKPYLERFVLEVPNRVSQNRIVYIHEGAARVRINFISYELRKGDVLLIPSNYILLIESYSNDIEPWMLDFNFGTEEEKEMVGIETLYFHMEERELKVLEYYFSLLSQIDNSSVRTNEDVMHLVMSMLYYLHQMYDARTGHLSWQKIPRAKQIKSEFVNMVVTLDNPPLTIAEYAKALHVSENYLSIIVKNETHQTVKKWIEQRTETQIKMLLAEPKGRTLNEIADIIGYSSPPQVVRFFKRRTGMTPYEYRKMALKERARLQK